MEKGKIKNCYEKVGILKSCDSMGRHDREKRIIIYEGERGEGLPKNSKDLIASRNMHSDIR
jgi:hypothetical protein